MTTEGQFWHTWRQSRKEDRARLGVPCPRCVVLLPKAHPKILMPGQRCKMHNYRDPRPWEPSK